jgi:hypothetical protein
MAQIGWIDFSPDHRDRVAAVLEMLEPEGVVDELGIGSIRDAFANQMFPGISTIQTRAKYFFLVPYLLYEYQQLPAAKQRNTQPEKFLESREFEVMWQLAEKYEHKVGTGVIGITKRRPEKIMRRPSAIYWNGLFVFDLIRHGGLGVNTFLRSRVVKADSLASESLQGDDSPRDDVDADYINSFHLRLPYDKQWIENLTLDLTPNEAKLFADRIRTTGKDLLIGALMKDNQLFKVFKNAEGFSDFARIAVSQKLLSSEVTRTVILAHDFSEVMYGAHCAYNCILQRKKFSSTDYADEWADWIKQFSTRMLDYKGFDPEAIVSMTPTLRFHTQQFLMNWWNFVTSSVPSPQKRDEIIEAQEAATKTYKARIRQNKLDDVSEGEWIGLRFLDYRARQVKIILQDVYSGLGAN